MSLLRPTESRSITSLPWSAGGPSLMAGSIESALRLIPLYAAVTGIADDVSTMPWHAYRDGGAAGSVRMPTQPKLLTEPGVGIGRIAWMNQGVMSCLLRGFAFGLIVGTDNAGWATKVKWVHPDHVQIDETQGAPIFRVNGKTIPTGEYVYIPAAVLPGSIVGLSPVTLFRLQLTKSISAQQYAAAFFNAGIMPPGVLKNTKRALPDGAAETIKARFKATTSGREPLVVGNDWEWTPLTVPRDDAVFLETIKAGATEIAAIYRVAPEDIGGASGSSMTYSTVELNELKRNRRALMPWVRRFEDALTDLLPRPQYVKANMDALARADLKTRMEAHQIALKTGLETITEGRSLEERPPLTDDEISQWQNLYGPRAGQPTTTATQGQAS